MTTPQQVYAEGLNATAGIVYWELPNNTREGVRGRVLGYQVRRQVVTVLITVPVSVFVTIPVSVFVTVLVSVFVTVPVSVFVTIPASVFVTVPVSV